MIVGLKEIVIEYTVMNNKNLPCGGYSSKALRLSAGLYSGMRL